MIDTKNVTNQHGFSEVLVLLVIVFIIGASYFTVVKLNKDRNQTPILSSKSKITETYKTGSRDVTVSYTADQKRQSDITWFQTQAEAFYGTYGYYPSLSDMNNPEFIANKMPGISSHLTDPDSSTKTQLLASQPTKNQYSYQVTDKSGANCEANDQLCAEYTFTTILSNGSIFQKSNLN